MTRLLWTLLVILVMPQVNPGLCIWELGKCLPLSYIPSPGIFEVGFALYPRQALNSILFCLILRVLELRYATARGQCFVDYCCKLSCSECSSCLCWSGYSCLVGRERTSHSKMRTEHWILESLFLKGILEINVNIHPRACFDGHLVPHCVLVNTIKDCILACKEERSPVLYVQIILLKHNKPK